SRPGGENAGGTYTISATLTPTTVLGNYDITYGTAAFTISKADTIVTAVGGAFTYDGSAHAGSGSAKGVHGEDLTPVTVAYTDGSHTVLTGAPVSAGSYLVAARYAGDGNYNAKQSAAVALTIGKAVASVSPAAKTKTYGGADPTLTGALAGFVAADNVTASYSRTAGETVATYVISATLSPAAVLSNYDITHNTAALDITNKGASVTPEPKTN